MWTTDRGWVHLHGTKPGATYMMRCRDCGYKSVSYPYLTVCPSCGKGVMVDDHCALPKAGS